MNFIILHGTGSGPDMWLPWLEKELKKLSHQTWMPVLPDPENPDLEKQLPYLLSSSKINSETVLVGHSAACPLILSVLENIQVTVKQAALVAGYFRTPTEQEPIWQENYNFEKIKSHCQRFNFIVSDNDPWGCNDQMSRPYFDELGGEMIIVKNGGHFGSNSFKQPLYEFPLLLKLIT